MAKLYGQGNWSDLDEGQRNEAAKLYLETISQYPEEYNKLLDAIEATKVEGINLENQILDINNQIRELLKPIEGVTDHLESWYEWTRKIADAQNKLNILTAQYSSLEKALGDKTEDKIDNLIQQGEQVRTQINANRED